jgi:hypothetical protein
MQEEDGLISSATLNYDCSSVYCMSKLMEKALNVCAAQGELW